MISPTQEPKPIDETQPPYYIDKKKEQELRIKASRGVMINRFPTSLTISQATSFDDYLRQLMIPTTVMQLARKASSIRFSAWETEAIRASIAFPEGKARPGLLRKILELKAAGDRTPATNPPYIRVACTGKGKFDYLAKDDSYMLTAAEAELTAAEEGQQQDDFGSPVVLELWPGQHYSPMHSHGDTTGIIYCLSGQIEVMAYAKLEWKAEKLGLMTLTPGQCAWLTKDSFAVHRV